MRRLLLALAVATVACGSDATEPTTMASVAGTWSLSTVNGTALPYILAQSGADKLEWTADVIPATSTGSFTQISSFRTTANGQVTTETTPDAGTFSLNGTAVTFTGSTGTGALNGNTMTVTGQGFALVYVKQ